MANRKLTTNKNKTVKKNKNNLYVNQIKPLG